MSARDEFVKAFGIVLAAPAPAADLDPIEAALGGALPPEVRAWYAEADGGKAQAPGSELSLLSVAEMKHWSKVMRLAKSVFGFVPFAENNDSNPICVCCKGPLTGFVVQTPHDDEPRLLYRSTDAFFLEARQQLSELGFFAPYELRGDVEGDARRAEDVDIARALVALASGEPALAEPDRSRALFFAGDLFPPAHPEEIYGLVALGDEYVRERVLRRLAAIGSAEAQALLASDEKCFDDFIERCVALLEAAGKAVSVHSHYGRKTLRLDDTKTWLNMPMLFAKRSASDFEERLLKIGAVD